MFSIPGQSVECLKKSIEKCISLGVEHISLYSLIVEDGTEMSRLIENGEFKSIGDETDRLMYLSAKTMLEENGYFQYEVSNFAKKGFVSKHNTAYWERKEYIGLGCAAHSFFNGIRYSNTKNLYEYINGICVKDIMENGERIYGVSEAEEIIMLGLRMNKGLSISDFYINTGFCHY